MAQNPPLTQGKMWEVFHKGKLYDPASSHYPHLPFSPVSCDRCNKQPIGASWGYETYDLCMTCLEVLRSEQSKPVQPVQPIHKIDPCIFPFPPTATFGGPNGGLAICPSEDKSTHNPHCTLVDPPPGWTMSKQDQTGVKPPELFRHQ